MHNLQNHSMTQMARSFKAKPSLCFQVTASILGACTSILLLTKVRRNARMQSFHLWQLFWATEDSEIGNLTTYNLHQFLNLDDILQHCFFFFLTSNCIGLWKPLWLLETRTTKEIACFVLKGHKIHLQANSFHQPFFITSFSLHFVLSLCLSIFVPPYCYILRDLCLPYP